MSRIKTITAGCLLAFGSVFNISPASAPEHVSSGVPQYEYPLLWDRPLDESHSPHVFFFGTPPFTVTWYFGQMPDPLPENLDSATGLEQIKRSVITEPYMTEGEDDFYFTDLTGSVFYETIETWVHVQNQHGFFARQEATLKMRDAPPPTSGQWFSVKPNYPAGHVLAQPPLSPYVQVNATTDVWVDFFRGETGDTSQLLKSGIPFGPPGGSSVSHSLFFSYFELTETMRVWARAYAGTGFIDIPAVSFVVESDTQVTFNNWYTVVENVDVGSTIQLRVDTNLSGLTYHWYWGESGDTSLPMTSVTGTAPMPVDFIFTRVPEQSRSFWVRTTVSGKNFDSPTALLNPLPLSLPVILDQPDDIKVTGGGGHNSFGANVVAVGGNLEYHWFYGEVGDESNSVTYSAPPNSNNNRRQFSINMPSTGKYWLKVQNQSGSVSSRQVDVSPLKIEDVTIMGYPMRTQLSQALAENHSGHTQGSLFWLQANTSFSQIKLYRVDGETPELVHESDPFSTFIFGNAHRSFLNFQSLPTAKLKTGTYRLRAYHGAEFVETGDILFEDLSSQEAVADHSIHAIVPSSGKTESGLLRAVIMVSGQFDTTTQKLFSGEIGDRSKPLELDLYQPIISQDLSYPDRPFAIRWKPNGSSQYWYEVKYPDGKTAAVALTYPDSHETRLPENSGGQWSIRIPTGAKSIPLPSAIDPDPEAPAWQIGEPGNTGLNVTWPLNLENFAAANMKIWRNLKQNPDIWQEITIEVDPGLPPVTSTNLTAAPMLEDGRVIWAGEVHGDVSQTAIFSSASDSDTDASWTPEGVFPYTVNQGLLIDPQAQFLRMEYRQDELTSEKILPVVRIPGAFTEAASAEYFIEDGMVSTTFGAFQSLSTYPWVRHSHLGWMYVQPLNGGLLFYASVTPDGYGWNWTHGDIWPYFYSATTESWHFCLPFFPGWFRNQNQNEWYFVQ